MAPRWLPATEISPSPSLSANKTLGIITSLKFDYISARKRNSTGDQNSDNEKAEDEGDDTEDEKTRKLCNAMKHSDYRRPRQAI
ncbi:hypothetical protein CHS0354_040643 [Potamilus streckersoni]|uniref:Uncharacterized protein n=1 Tax=Potamilus streckersoni TaxID=2493646 RepID=A0AAE0TDG6_9BIVA|nr:hypothetical protein CHS0354_040643 [Potamilus streckersoni]